jgi:GWxTD domain-containing protein
VNKNLLELSTKLWGWKLVLPILFLLGWPLHAQPRGSPSLSPQRYLQRLQTVSADTLRDEYETEFIILLDENEKKIYQALPLPERRHYIIRYWRLHDPDPFTPGNERLDEHLQRRAYAYEHFRADKPPYFDDRGRIYLKYGHPKFRYVDPGANMLINQDLSILIPDGGYVGEQAVFDSTGIRRISQTGSLNPWERTAALLPPGSVTVLENETWSYDHIQSGLLFNFVRLGSQFKLRADLQSAVSGGRLQYRTLQSAALYLQRQTISPVYFDLARELEDVGHQMRSSTGAQSPRRLDDKIYHAVNQTTSSIKQTMREAPPEAFIHKINAAPLPFVADITQFRSEQNQTRVAIVFGVNLGANATTTDSTGNWLAEITYSYALSNLNGENVARAEQRQNVATTESGAASVLGSVGVMEFRCEPASYVLALQAAAAAGSHKSLSRLPLAVRDFSGSHLMLSDIQFFLQISGAADSTAKKILYPFATALASIPLTVYFEIYNLDAIGLNKNYQVEYTVAEEKSGKSLLSKLTKPFSKKDEASITISEQRTVTQPISRESLALSLEKLQPGSYQLAIIVRAVDDPAIFAKAVKPLLLAKGN